MMPLSLAIYALLFYGCKKSGVQQGPLELVEYGTQAHFTGEETDAQKYQAVARGGSKGQS